MELSGRRPVFIATVFAMFAVALTLFIASSDTPKAQATSYFDVTYAVRNCNDLPSIPPWTTFGLNGPDLHGAGGVGGPNTVSDCHVSEEPPSIEVTSPNTITDLSTRLCVPGRTAVPDCPASIGGPNLGSMNFSSVINYIPNGYQINCKGTCPATLPSDTLLGADLAVGELVGGGDNSVHLQAATQGDCLSTFQVPFIFYNVALPAVGTPGVPSVFGNPDPRTSANIAFPRNEGHADRFGRWNVGSIPADADPNNVVDGTADNKADSTTLSIANYPSYLLDAFDPDFIPGVGDNADSAQGGAHPNNLPPVVPVAVYGGMTQPVPASTDWVPLYFVQFAPGQLSTGAVDGLWGAPHPFSTYVAGNGAPNVVVLNDPTAVKGAVSAIQDFCSHVRSNTMLLGTGGAGHVRFKTPAAAATYTYINTAKSLRDTDFDGRENAFDTCPFTPDGPGIDGSSHNGGVAGPFIGFDDDGDGVYNSCDPNPSVAADVGACAPRTCTATDKDGDGFDNEQDNCPLVHNGLAPVDTTGDGQKETELTLLTWPADGGPKTDSIGDACETNTVYRDDPFTNSTGNSSVNSLQATFETTKIIAQVISVTGGTSPDTWDWKIGTHGVNVKDSCTAGDETVLLTGTGGTQVTTGTTLTVVVRTCAAQTSLSATTAQWKVGLVNEGAPFGPVVMKRLDDPANPDPPDFLEYTANTAVTVHTGNGPMNCSIFEDADCDGFTKNWETYMGTDAADNCPATTVAGDEAVDAWPPDNNDDRKANLTDILAYIPVFNLVAATPAQKRYDMNSSGKIDLTDILMFIPYFNITCVP
jgi:hypothetical protein